MVPDTWSVINDQDAVTRAAKFGIFKRPGHRVLINSRGDMLVRDWRVTFLCKTRFEIAVAVLSQIMTRLSSIQSGSLCIGHMWD